MIFKMTLRCTAIIAGLLAATAAQADIAIPVNALEVNTVQAFSDRCTKALRAINTTISALGTTTPVPGAALVSFSLPITSITIGNGLKIVKGAGLGTALKFDRKMDDGSKAWVVLANFWLDYATKRVLADGTIPGSPTVKDVVVYHFNMDSPLALKYKFPLSITGREVVNKLMLGESVKDLFMAGLQLDEFVRPGVLDTTDFGTLTTEALVKFRSKPGSAKPYVVVQ